MRTDRNIRNWTAGAVLLASVFMASGLTGAWAATTSSTFNVTITITATCSIASAGSLSFGTVGLLTANIDSTATLSVLCTNTTPYNIGLNAGTTTGATTTTRLLANGATTIGYRMFSDSGRSSNWGNTVGTDTVSATGNGSAQNFVVYGRVPVQTSVAPGTYTDIVTITVTY